MPDNVYTDATRTTPTSSGFPRTTPTSSGFPEALLLALLTAAVTFIGLLAFAGPASWALPGLALASGAVALAANLLAVAAGPRVAAAVVLAAYCLGFEAPFALVAGANVGLLALNLHP